MLWSFAAAGFFGSLSMFPCIAERLSAAVSVLQDFVAARLEYGTMLKEVLSPMGFME
jgi:hypothetical protein